MIIAISVLAYLIFGFLFSVWMIYMNKDNKEIIFDGSDLALFTAIWPYTLIIFLIMIPVEFVKQTLNIIAYKVQGV